MDNELSGEEVVAVIDRMIRQWQLESKGIEIAIKVHKKIGSPQEIIDRLTADMVRIEKGIDELEAERKVA